MKQSCTILMILCGLCLTAGQALGGMSVSPLKQEVTVKPGEVGEVVVTVWNGDPDGKATVEDIAVQILDVEATDEGTLFFPPPGTASDSASKWITPDHAQLTLQPNQSERLVFKIAPPQTAAPGEYYAAVMVSTASKPDTRSGVNIQFRTASGIFVTVAGRTFPKQAKIERCEVLWPDIAAAASQTNASTNPSPAVSESVNLMPKVSILVRNTGKVRFDGSGKVSIQNATGQEVFSSVLTSKRACVFGGDSRLFEAVLTKPLPAGMYVIKSEIDYESAWGKVRHKMPLEVLPDQAALMASRCRSYQQGQAPVAVAPEKIAVVVQPGATRNLALAVENLGEKPIRGTAAVGVVKDSEIGKWIQVAPTDLVIGRAGRKTVVVRVQVPAGVAGGTYASAVILKVGSEGSPLLERVVPVEIEVQAER